MDDIYKNIVEEYNTNKKRKTSIVSDDLIADILRNKKFNSIVIKLFIRGRKNKHYTFSITQSYFAVPKNIRLNSTQYYIMKIFNKQRLQQITFNHSSDIGFKNFMNLY